MEVFPRLVRKVRPSELKRSEPSSEAIRSPSDLPVAASRSLRLPVTGCQDHAPIGAEPGVVDEGEVATVRPGTRKVDQWPYPRVAVRDPR